MSAIKNVISVSIFICLFIFLFCQIILYLQEWPIKSITFCLSDILTSIFYKHFYAIDNKMKQRKSNIEYVSHRNYLYQSKYSLNMCVMLCGLIKSYYELWSFYLKLSNMSVRGWREKFRRFAVLIAVKPLTMIYGLQWAITGRI